MKFRNLYTKFAVLCEPFNGHYANQKIRTVRIILVLIYIIKTKSATYSQPNVKLYSTEYVPLRNLRHFFHKRRFIFYTYCHIPINKHIFPCRLRRLRSWPNQKSIVVSPDDRFESALKGQGIGFIKYNP